MLAQRVVAEFLFQVISDRAEKTALIVTTNLPFSEWTTVFPNPRLCKALLDRITDRAHIIETGTESFNRSASAGPWKGGRRSDELTLQPRTARRKTRF
jgi:DNA replication protein DnaC